MRAGLSVGVIVALVIAIWVAVSSGDDEPAPTTLETTTTSATTLTTTTTTTPPATTATTSGSTTTPTETTVDEEARTEEVRLILEDLWFGWFDALHRQDESAVHEVIATERGLDNFREAAASGEHDVPPTRTDIRVTEIEILLDDPDCLVTYSTLDVSAFRGEGAISSGVDVLWPHDGGWRRASRWGTKDDLWEADCTSIREELP